MRDYDAVVIGAGHNGLTCAAYLGTAGLKVKVFEKRHLIGGAAVTEEFYPGFRNSVAAYAVSLLNPKIIDDLQLHAHGLQIVERVAQNFLPNLNGQYLLLSDAQPQRDIAKLSSKDAQNYDGFIRNLDNCADVLRDLVLRAPPNLTAGLNLNSLSELARSATLLNRLRRTSLDQLRTVFDFLTKPVSDILDGWFENDLVKSLFAFDAVVGNFASPYTLGTAYGLLHHAFGEVNGKKRVWGHAIGGMGAVTQAMARAAKIHGVDVETNAPVREVLVENRRARALCLPTDGWCGQRSLPPM